MSSGPEQSPPRKRLKISPSKPFRFEPSQACNSQNSGAEAAPSPTKQSVTDESQPLQGIQAEWPNRGRTNERGQASITAGCSPARRSQSPPCALVLPKPLSRSRSISPRTAKKYLLQAGMDAPYPHKHAFPPNIISYVEFLEDLEEKSIPLTLKDKVIEFITTHPENVSFLKPNLSKPFEYVDIDSPKLYYEPTPEDNDTRRMTSEFDVLMEIQEKAESCHENYKDEYAWLYDVVVPLLGRALHKPVSSISTVEWVKSQTINLSFLPEPPPSESSSSPLGIRAGDMQKKKVDIAIFLDIESEASDVVALYKALRQYIEESLMNDPWTGSMIPFSIIDVQLDRVEESKVRMMTAAGSILKYLRYLLDERTSLSDMKPDVHASLLQRLPPVLGWMVRGHEWKFHVCYRSDKDRLVWASLSLGDGSTSSAARAVRLLRIIEAVKADFGQKYVAWLKEVFGLEF